MSYIIPKDFDFLERHIVEKTDEYIVYDLPHELNIDINLINQNFKDAEINLEGSKRKIKIWLK